MKRSLSIALVGCGKAGTAIALGLKRAGHRITAVTDVDPAAERRAARRLLRRPIAGCQLPTAEPGSAVRGADVVLIATPDAQIRPAYRLIAASLRRSQTVVHFSGALSSRVLETRRAAHGSLAMHPVMTFPGFESGPSLKGCWFALEGNRQGIATGQRLVKALGGKAFVIRARDRPLFHAACVLASNLLDVTIDAALELCAELGLKASAAFRILRPLIDQTVRNIAERGTLQALSGPVERGDVETVRRHLAALRRRSPKLVRLYRVLSAQAQVMAAKKHRGIHSTGHKG